VLITGIQVAINLAMAKIEKKIKTKPRLHPVVTIVSLALVTARTEKAPFNWDSISLEIIKAECAEKKRANPDWNPDFFDLPVETYLQDLAPAKRWWLSRFSAEPPEARQGAYYIISSCGVLR